MPVAEGRFNPLSPKLAHWVTALPWAYFDPVFMGLDRPDLRRPALWVGNHTLYGMLDTPLPYEHLYREAPCQGPWETGVISTFRSGARRWSEAVWCWAPPRTAGRSCRATDALEPPAPAADTVGLSGRKGLTASGFELAFGTSHMGHFLLTT